MQDDLDYISFAEWLVQLTLCAKHVGYIKSSFIQETGQLEWYEAYLNGLSPEVAIRNAERDGQEFGTDYS